MTSNYTILIDPRVKMLREQAEEVGQQIANAAKWSVTVIKEYKTKRKDAITVDAQKIYGIAKPPFVGSSAPEAEYYMFVLKFDSWAIASDDEARFAAMCVSEIVASPVSLIPTKIRTRGHSFCGPGIGKATGIWRDESKLKNESLVAVSADSALNGVFFKEEKRIWGIR
jgi:hypothetical protein